MCIASPTVTHFHYPNNQPEKFEGLISKEATAVNVKLRSTQHETYMMTNKQAAEPHLPQLDTPTREVLPSPAVQALQGKLMQQIGKEIHVGEWYRVTQNCIDRFSDLTDDKQWIHVDPDRARLESPFRSTIAHGLLILSLLPRLRGLESYSNLYDNNIRLVVNQGFRKVKFLSPVKSDTEIRSRTSLKTVVVNKRSLDIVEEVVVETGSTRRRACFVELRIRAYL